MSSADVPLIRVDGSLIRYGKSDHPIAFHKGDMFAASRKKIADQGPVPDNEDVFEVGAFTPKLRFR